MQLVIGSKGRVNCLYSEAVDLAALGLLQIVRASVVEADTSGQWWADLTPVDGPMLGPFARRSLALAAEVAWLERYVLCAAWEKDLTLRRMDAGIVCPDAAGGVVGIDRMSGSALRPVASGLEQNAADSPAQEKSGP